MNGSDQTHEASRDGAQDVPKYYRRCRPLTSVTVTVLCMFMGFLALRWTGGVSAKALSDLDECHCTCDSGKVGRVGAT